MNSVFSQEEISILHSPQVTSWLQQKATDKKSLATDATNAQALYRKLKDIIIPQNFHVKSQAEYVQALNDRIFQEIDTAFKQIGLNGFTNTFIQELQKQRLAKQTQIKQDCIAKGMILWHASPLSKEQLEGGILKGKVERPDLVWEQIFTGVCAFPENKGAYVLKHTDEKGGFAAQADINVRLTDDRLEGKKINDVLGYLHGHRLTNNDGFLPTISLTGEVAPEWTTTQDVVIDESKSVTLKTLIENGVHIFMVSPKDLSLINQIKSQQIKSPMSREEAIQADIEFMEDLAAHPHRTYFDENGQVRHINIKSYFSNVSKRLQNSHPHLKRYLTEHSDGKVTKINHLNLSNFRE